LRRVLDGLSPGLGETVLIDHLTQLHAILGKCVSGLGVTRTVSFCDSHLQSEVRAKSLNDLLVNFMCRYSDAVTDTCSECLALLTPDTVACGIKEGKKLRVDIIPGQVTLDLEMGDFYSDWTGCRVWPGAVCLSRKFLTGEYPVSNVDVLELGSGVGISGISASLSGAHEVTFTEYKESLLRTSLHNAESVLADRSTDGVFSGFLLDWVNFSAQTDAHFQDWLGRRSREWIFIGSEVVYEEVHVELILGVFNELFSAGASRGVISIMTNPSRSGADRFLKVVRHLPEDSPFHARVSIEPTLEGSQTVAFIFLTRRDS
jgi:predicted nicotinamide N-methyase